MERRADPMYEQDFEMEYTQFTRDVPAVSLENVITLAYYRVGFFYCPPQSIFFLKHIPTIP